MFTGGTNRNTPQNGFHLVVVGAGGNIGSHLVPLLGRMAETTHLTLIDPDVYEGRNLQSQDISLDDLGKAKVQVQAMRLKKIAPELPVTTLVAAVEDVPWGRLRGDLILTGLDTRRARQAVNRRVRWLGIPWLDAGVEAGSGLARLSSFGPGADQPCLECAWTDADYQLLEQRYSCDGSPLATPASGAPARLGALAAAWQAIECARLLAAGNEYDRFGREWVITPEGAEVFQSHLSPHAGCRLPEHRSWDIEMLTHQPDGITLADAFGLAEVDAASRRTLSLEVPDQDFITRLECRVCGRQKADLVLETSLRDGLAHCDSCGWHTPVTELNPEDGLRYENLDTKYLEWSLADLGLRPGEVFRLVSDDLERHFQLPLPAEHPEEAGHEA